MSCLPLVQILFKRFKRSDRVRQTGQSSPLSLQGLQDWRVCKFSQQRDNPSTYKKDISSYMSVHYSVGVCEDSDDKNQSILQSVKLEGRVRSKLSQVLTQ